MAPTFSNPNVGWTKLALLPILIVALAYVIKGISSDIPRLGNPFPLNSWESAIVVDDWRAAHGQAVYTDAQSGHATHMYGALATFASAPFVRAIGPDPRIARAISFVAASALC
ncbi:MAG: hypothetical protein H7Z14_15620 [Anaerolineae bacterium]|nr:hypothetical protein [Phycisphaerae bacterium]